MNKKIYKVLGTMILTGMTFMMSHQLAFANDGEIKAIAIVLNGKCATYYGYEAKQQYNIYVNSLPREQSDMAKETMLMERLVGFHRYLIIIHLLVTHDKELLPICDQIIELKKLQSA